MTTLVVAGNRSCIGSIPPESRDGARFVFFSGGPGDIDLAKESENLTDDLGLGIDTGMDPWLDWTLGHPLLRTWWLIDIKVQYALFDAVCAVKKARLLLEGGGFTRVVLAVDDAVSRRAMRSVFESAGIPVAIASRSPPRRKFLARPNLRVLHEAFRKAAARFRGAHRARSKNGRPTVVFNTFGHCWQPIPGDPGAMTERYIGEIIDCALDRSDIRAIIIGTGHAASFRSPATVLRELRNLATGALPYIPLELFDSGRVRRKLRETSRAVTKRQQDLIKQVRAGTGAWKFDGVDLLPSVLPAIMRALADIPSYFRRFLLFENMVRHLEPDAVVHYGEAAMSGRVLTAACQSAGTPVVGIQHGRNLDYGYKHSRTGVRSGQEGAPTGCPVPDLTLVYGPSWRHSLVNEMAYPADSVEDVGYHRLDALFEARKAPPETVRNLLYISSPMPPEQRGIIIDCLRRIEQEATGLDIVIKPHYMEGASTIDDGSIAVSSPRELVTPLIIGADLIIAGSSTAVLEAAACGKPVICITLSQAPNRFPYSELGIAEGAASRAEFLKAAFGLIASRKLREDRIRRADEGLTELLTHTDSRVTERIVDRISQVAREKFLTRSRPSS